MKKTKNEKGLFKNQIEAIKSRIASCSEQKQCKAEVYEVWQNIFEPE